MGKNTDELINLINKAVEEKTFSIEVLQNIADLRKQVAVQDQKITELNAVNKDQSALLREIQEKNCVLVSNETKVSEREKKVAAEEMKQALNTQKTEMTTQFKNELMTVTLAAFKNTTIKQSIFGNESGNGMNTTSSKSTTIEQE